MRQDQLMNKPGKLFFAFMLLLSVHGYSQNFLSVSAGYGFPLASEVVARRSNYSSFETKNINGSFGQGFNVAVGLTRMFTEEIGASVEMQLKLGRTYESTWEQTRQDGENPNGIVTGNDRSTDRSGINYLALSPGVFLKTNRGSIHPYSKIGFIAALAVRNTDYTDTYENSFKIETKGNIAFGAFATAGIEYEIKNHIFYVEFSAIAMSWQATTAKSIPNAKENLYYYENGTNWPSPKWVASKTEEFSVNYTYPLSSWNLNVGVKFGL